VDDDNKQLRNQEEKILEEYRKIFAWDAGFRKKFEEWGIWSSLRDGPDFNEPNDAFLALYDENARADFIRDAVGKINGVIREYKELNFFLER
jgi:hypothetical protein